MKIFLPARHGLGNVLEQYFVRKWLAVTLAKVRQAYIEGIVDEVIVLYEHYMNGEAISEIFQSFDFPVKAIATKDFPNTVIGDRDNLFPNELNGYINAYNLPKEISTLQISGFIQIPTKKPKFELPCEYICFHPFAGEDERFLRDSDILNTIKSITNLPIITIGKAIDRNGKISTNLRSEYDLVNQLSITESLYVMQGAKLIVSALTFLRACSTMFGSTVIELVEKNRDNNLDVIKRTAWEYSEKCYGIIDNRNFWYCWPSEKEQFIDCIKKYI